MKKQVIARDAQRFSRVRKESFHAGTEVRAGLFADNPRRRNKR